MRPKFKISFLPAFFAVLTLTVVIAIALRVYSFTTEEPQAQIQGSAGTVNAPLSSIATASRAPSSAIQEEAAPQATDAGGTFAATASTAPSSYAAAAARRAIIEERRKNLLTRPIAPEAAAVAAPGPVVAVAPRAAVVTPPRPAPPRPVERSLISRIVEPIRNLVSGTSEPAKSAEPPKKPVDPKDPTSDSTPPRLVAISFNPPTVHDGEESVVQIVATDDISGIRNVSASISSPNGKALRAFPFQREGETDQWVGKVQVPKDAEEGLWHINFLSMTDNANNTVNLTYSNGTLPQTATLRVLSSGSDSTAPTLTAIWVEKRAVTEGEHNTVFVQADDDKSGVALISGVFQSPKKAARIGFGCRVGNDPQTWQCDVTLPKCVDCGDWSLEQVQLQDKANNQTTVRNTNPLVAAVIFNVAGQSCDSQPPVLSSMTLDPPVVSNIEASRIRVTAIVTDDNCGVASVSGQAAGPTPADGGQPPRIYFPMTPVQDQPNMWSGEIIVPKFAAKGVWHIVWVQAVDKANNLKPYSQGDAPLPGITFRVQ